MTLITRHQINTNNDAISLLEKAQHSILLGFEQFDDLPEENVLEKKKLVERILTKIRQLRGIEESIFFPAILIQQHALKSVIQQSIALSSQAQNVISKLQVMNGDEEHYTAAVISLAELTEQHTLHQQKCLFPSVKNSSVDINALGHQITQQHIPL